MGVPKNGALRGDVLADPRCDEEIADMMERLNKLQGWLVMQAVQRRGDAHFMSASRLIQDVRVLLVERCFNAATKPSPHREDTRIEKEDEDGKQ